MKRMSAIIHRKYNLISKIIGLFMLTGIFVANAQVRKYKTPPAQDVADTKAQGKPFVKKISKKVIQGRVLSPSGLGIPYATIFFKGANINVKADKEGNFKLIVPVHLIKNEIVLVAGAEGYTNKEFTIEKKDLNAKHELAIENQKLTIVVASKSNPSKSNLSANDSISTKKKWWPFHKKRV